MGLAVAVTTTAAQLLPVLTTVPFVPVANPPLFTPARLRAPVPRQSTLLDGIQRGTLAGPQACGRNRVCRWQLDIRAGLAVRRDIAEVCPALRVRPPVHRVSLSNGGRDAVEQAHGKDGGTHYWSHITI